MRHTQEDAIRARAMGISLEAPDDKEAEIGVLCRKLGVTSDDRDEWQRAFFQMRASRDKWKQRFLIVFGVVMVEVALALFFTFAWLFDWIGSANGR